MKHIALLCLVGFFCAAAQASDPPKYCEDANSDVTCIAPDGTAVAEYYDGTVVYCSHDKDGNPHCIRSNDR